MDKNTTALLSLDIQLGLFQLAPPSEVVLPKAIQAAEYARKIGLPVIHVGMGFESGHPEIPENHPMFGFLKDKNLFVKGTPTADVPEALKKSSDIFLFKQRVSGFSENQLDMILRAKNIKTLLLMGISTSGIVLSTLRQAFDKDYQCVVIKDACFDPDPEVHRVLLDKVFANMAKVITADELEHI